jgi:sodium-independent sulfate anion transporter 11
MAHSMATATEPSTSTKIGHGLAKVFRIKLNYRNPTGTEDLTRGESVFSVSSADTYVEEEPTVAEWLRSLLPTGPGLLHYVTSLFPFLTWITRYNVQWLFGDLVAGMLENNAQAPPGP